MSEENWLCLHCGAVRCSRYANSHNIQHWRDSGHNISLSLRDLSVWCYACNKYVKSCHLTNILTQAQAYKFPYDSSKLSNNESVQSQTLTGICYSSITESHFPHATHTPSIGKLESPERLKKIIVELENSNILSR